MEIWPKKCLVHVEWTELSRVRAELAKEQIYALELAWKDKEVIRSREGNHYAGSLHKYEPRMRDQREEWPTERVVMDFLRRPTVISRNAPTNRR